MSKLKIAAAFVDATLKLTAAEGAMVKAVVSGAVDAIDTAIEGLQGAVEAFKDARKNIETS